MVRLLIIAAGVWGAVTALAFLFGERIMFQPPPPSYNRSTVPFTRVPVGDGAVAVQHVANPDARYTLLFSHGNAEDLGHLQPLIQVLKDAGFGVLAYDYRGYGRSTGPRPSTRSAIEDAETVYRYATAELGIPPDRLIVHGRSLGGGPALEIATRHPVAGVVLESTFTSAYRVVTHIPLFLFDRYTNLDLIRDLRVPVLVLHGERDLVIRAAHGRALFAAAREPKRCLWVEEAGHNDLATVGGEKYIRALRAFSEIIGAQP